MTAEESSIVIAEHASGSVSDPKALSEKITREWAIVISNPTGHSKRSRNFSLLRAEDKLHSDKPPSMASNTAITRRADTTNSSPIGVSSEPPGDRSNRSQDGHSCLSLCRADVWIWDRRHLRG
jgi:hypothetical protein